MDGRRTVFLVLSGDAERLLRVGLWALTAASCGETVELLLTAPALRSWVDPVEGPDAARSLGLPPWRAMVEEARALAPVKVLSCETEVALSGVSLEAARAAVDEVESLPSFWRRLGEARVVTI
jgi:peroxiredoxin family protein